LPSRALNWLDLARFALRRTWRDLVTLLLSAVAGGVLGMAVPLAAAYLIDSVIPDHDHSQLPQLAALLAILGVAAFVMSYVGGIAFSRFESRAGPALQAAIIDRLLRLPAGFFRAYSAGDLALRASAATHVQQLVAGSAASAVTGGVFALFSFGLLLYYDWKMGLWALLVTVLYAGATLLLALLRLTRERPLARLGGELQSMLLQFVGGIAKIRLSASEDRAFARWAVRFAAAERLRVAANGFGSLQAALNALFGLAALFFFFLVLGNFGAGVADDALAVGAFAAFLAAFHSFHGGVAQMTHTLTRLMAVQPLLERAMPILRTAPEVREDKDDPGPLSGALEITHLSFGYERGGPLVLDDVSISSRPGEFIALVGASGSGKSTLLRLLLGFETPDSGGILFDGKDLRDLDLSAVRRQMGVVLQDGKPLPGSLFDNIAGISGGSMDDAWDAARRVGLAADIERMPMGMHTMIAEGGGTLSTGQLQRLMIARAIVGRPRILILDEATSALDNRTQATVTESLERLSITRVVVAHRLSTVANAHRIFVLDRGRVVESGGFDELMRAGGHFARLAAAQIV
ncbi:MAG: NHLP bacteriocin export ABC transporter permease/ATPase subunit, partial [Burkholderiaceae bacterium]